MSFVFGNNHQTHTDYRGTMPHKTSTSNNPVASWLIPTTLYGHRWGRRLEEFLTDDLPAEHGECIFLGRQDPGFAYKAKSIGQKVVDAMTATSSSSIAERVTRKWDRVRFIGSYASNFNVAESRNILLQEAQGDVVFHRDADVALTQYGFTRFALKRLIQSRAGLLSFPSLNNGLPFKPEPNMPTLPDPRPIHGEGILLAASANGMAVAMLRSVANDMGGQNIAHARWGVYTALCTKLARAGYLSGYTEPAYWLSTSDDESSVSLTDGKRNPDSQLQKGVGVAMLSEFYDIKPHDAFQRGYFDRYGVNDQNRSPEVSNELDRRFATFITHQALANGRERYDFKPWECLSHRDTPDYINQAYQHAEPFFAPVEERLRQLDLL
jgi:hypothetical protein